jgi:hypothetical protein
MTLTLSIEMWVYLSLSGIFGGKLLQQSGRQWAKGKAWIADCFFGAILTVSQPVIIGLSLAMQSGVQP